MAGGAHHAAAHLPPVQAPPLHVGGQHVVPALQHLLRSHPLQQAPDLHNVLVAAGVQAGAGRQGMGRGGQHPGAGGCPAACNSLPRSAAPVPPGRIPAQAPALPALTPSPPPAAPAASAPPARPCAPPPPAWQTPRATAWQRPGGRSTGGGGRAARAAAGCGNGRHAAQAAARRTLKALSDDSPTESHATPSKSSALHPARQRGRGCALLRQWRSSLVRPATSLPDGALRRCRRSCRHHPARPLAPCP